MIEYYVGDPYFINKGRRDIPPMATVVPFRKGVTYETSTGLLERFMNWVIADDGKPRFAMSSPINLAIKRGMEFGEVFACARAADDGLFRVVMFACDEAEGSIPTEDDVNALYSKIARLCVKEGVTSISVPLLFEESGINNNRVAKIARAAFREADVECMLYITSSLMAKVLGR